MRSNRASRSRIAVVIAFTGLAAAADSRARERDFGDFDCDDHAGHDGDVLSFEDDGTTFRRLRIRAQNGDALLFETQDGSDHGRDLKRAQLTIRVNGRSFAQIGVSGAPKDGATNLFFGPAYRGPHEEAFVYRAGRLSGEADGRAFAPLPLDLAHESTPLAFANGAPVPGGSVEPGALQRAVDLLNRMSTTIENYTSHLPGSPQGGNSKFSCASCTVFQCSSVFADCMATHPACIPCASSNDCSDPNRPVCNTSTRACVPSTGPSPICVADPGAYCHTAWARCETRCTGGCEECCTGADHCDPVSLTCQPPPQGPPFPELKLFADGHLITSKNTLGFHTATWGPNVLGSIPSTTLVHNSKVAASFQMIPIPAPFSRYEALLFTRDPAEFTDSVSTIYDDHVAWDASLDSRCGDAETLGLPYPLKTFDPTIAGPSIVGSAVGSTSPDLWLYPTCPAGGVLGGSSATGAGAPGGNSSIKAARVYDRGVCGSEVSTGGTNGVYDQIFQALFKGFADKVADSGCADPSAPYFYAVTSISENPFLSPDIIPKDGFVTNYHFMAHNFLPGFLDTNVHFNYRYQLLLDDGVLSATGYQNIKEGDGYTGSDTANSFADAMDNQIPSGIHDIAISQQAVDPFPKQADCEPDNPGETSVPVGGQLCSAQIGALADAMHAASDIPPGGTSILTQLGLDRVADVQPLIDILKEPDPHNPSAYHNWRCAKGSKNAPNNNRCLYTIRAKRLNVFPNTLNLVWFDDLPTDLHNRPLLGSTLTALPLYVALTEINDTNNLTSLCNGVARPDAIERRAYGFIATSASRDASDIGDCTSTVLTTILTGIFSDPNYLRKLLGETLVLVAL